MTRTDTIQPTYFISHGGGPWPWIPRMRAMFAPLERSLKDMVAEWETPPRAILMVSGHWEGERVQVMGAARPPMVYDYYNFPPHTYEVVYGAPGAPDVAARVMELLAGAGIAADLDTERGYDHGVFAPMEVMYPEAEVPLLQVSILSSYDPAAHFALGRALAPLRREGVMIVGSGLSYHNLRLMGAEGAAPSAAFDAWLAETMAMAPQARTARLMDWERAPAARICHPEEDHLVPLFVALGAAEDETAVQVYHDVEMMGSITASGYRFGTVQGAARPLAAAAV